MSLALIAQLPHKLLTFSPCNLMNLALISTGNRVFAAPKAGGSGNPMGRKRFRRPPKSSDPEYVVSHVAGSNYFVNGEDVKIKDDSEYPDWIWNLNLGRPKQPDELEHGTKEYWEALKYNNWVKHMRLQGYMPKRRKTVDPKELRELQWKKRIRYRALAADDVDPGLDPEDYKQRPDKKMFLRPNRVIEEEEFYADEFVAKHPERVMKMSRPGDYIEQVAPKSRISSRGKSGYFPNPAKISIHPESFLAKLPNLQELVSKSISKKPVIPELKKIDGSNTNS